MNPTSIANETERFKNDAKQRARHGAKLCKKCNRHRQPKACQSPRYYGRFLNIEESAQVLLDEKKNDLAALWDGLYGVGAERSPAVHL